MRINTNVIALNSHRNLSMNTFNTSKNTERLSSGLRINRAADDAAGLSISEVMRGQIRGLSQAQRNVQDGISFVQTAEGALNEVSAMLTRMKELNVQKENGTYSDEDIKNINAELDELGLQIDAIIENTTFNGIHIGGDDAADVKIVVDDIGTEIVIESFANEAAFTDLDSTNTRENIEAAIKQVAAERGTLGAKQNRLEYTSNNLGTTVENLQASESRIRDTDMALEMMGFTKNNILTQAATAMLAQANQLPQGVLQLIR
ncbi:flagellin [Bacillus horti]|uniref:Flagellin n=1 Tax=Caldalkalibacillus horti TaxID=77523 RepID=A0ABT9VZT7_9BACI|nr:flagellin [Bacillus horti]MDQ0166337.1 flagellin [Bacillus horti]